MADDTPPDELVQARRAFMAADAELSRLAAAPKMTVENGAVVGADAELNAKMNAVREEMRRLAEFLAGHDWIRGNGRYAAWLKVDAAAKADR